MNHIYICVYIYIYISDVMYPENFIREQDYDDKSADCNKNRRKIQKVWKMGTIYMRQSSIT